jgi:hypothetical protein
MTPGRAEFAFSAPAAPPRAPRSRCPRRPAGSDLRSVILYPYGIERWGARRSGGVRAATSSSMTLVSREALDHRLFYLTPSAWPPRGACFRPVAGPVVFAPPVLGVDSGMAGGSARRGNVGSHLHSATGNAGSHLRSAITTAEWRCDRRVRSPLCSNCRSGDVTPIPGRPSIHRTESTRHSAGRRGRPPPH